MSYPITDEQDYPRITPAVQWLIAANALIFFLQLTVVSRSDMIGALGFELRDFETASWWTIATYMFVHAGFWHLALNMYTLWLFGPRVEHSWTAGGFVRYYVWCGLGGWLFHLLLTRDATLVGASAAVFGVMLAYAMRWPDDEMLLFGVVPMKVKWMVGLLTVMSLAFGLGMGSSSVAHFAHLGGFAFGWMYLRTSSAQSLDRLRQRISQVPDVPDETPRAIPRSLPRSRERGEVDEIVAKSKAAIAKRPAPQITANHPRDTKADELDLVLDKISRTGIDSLTSEERRLLEEMSKRLRDR
jgi:membrane associated rhomboid family serine protease